MPTSTRVREGELELSNGREVEGADGGREERDGFNKGWDMTGGTARR